MLIKRSQLHPVMNSAAAGGKRIATCLITAFRIQSLTMSDEQFGMIMPMLTRIRITSDALTIVTRSYGLNERALGVTMNAFALCAGSSWNLISGRQT